MGINMERCLKDKRLMSAMTGMTPEEFQNLIPAFSLAWLHKKHEQHERDAKKRKFGGGRTGFLKTIPEKLFFILFYYKCYPTYDLLSVIYGWNRSNACRRQFQISPMLEEALGRKLVLPVRQIRSIEEFVQAFPEAKEVFIDGTERPIQRPKDKKKQEEYYSGKKKRHTNKNIVITEKNKRVGFLGETSPGKENDFTLLKEEASPDHMPKDIKKHVDSGFQGIETQFPGHDISIPKKKPRLKVLDQKDKQANTKKASVRVLVENALAGVKRFRIVTDVFRNRKEGFDDTVMLLSSGLWNFHLSMK